MKSAIYWEILRLFHGDGSTLDSFSSFPPMSMFLTTILNILHENIYDVWGGKEMFLDVTKRVPLLRGIVNVILKQHPINDYVTKQAEHPENGLKVFLYIILFIR